MPTPHGSHAHFVVEVFIIAPLMLLERIAMIVWLKTMRIVLSAVVYFLSVMVAGFALGMVREFIFVPAVGRGMGEPLEAPFMLTAIAMSAWIATGWCKVPPGVRYRLAMGVLSLALVLAAELGLSPFVRGSVKAWFDSFTPLTLALALVLWAAHAAMPALVRR
jgi:hypothetical protein